MPCGLAHSALQDLFFRAGDILNAAGAATSFYPDRMGESCSLPCPRECVTASLKVDLLLDKATDTPAFESSFILSSWARSCPSELSVLTCKMAWQWLSCLVLCGLISVMPLLVLNKWKMPSENPRDVALLVCHFIFLTLLLILCLLSLCPDASAQTGRESNRVGSFYGALQCPPTPAAGTPEPGWQ